MRLITQIKLLDFALGSLMRRKGRNGAVLIVFTFVVSLLFSILFITDSLKRESADLLDSSPDIVVQRVLAGRHDLIPTEYAEKITEEPGVLSAMPRIWGYYYDSFTKSNYTIMGTGQASKTLFMLEGRLPESDEECALGEAVAASRGVALGDDLALIDANAMGRNLSVTGIFKGQSSILTNDLVILSDDSAADFFSMPVGKATDIAVKVANPAEADALARKIHRFFPDTRPITKKEVLRTYDAVLNWRSGMLLAALFGAVMAFCVLAWDKATGLSAEEKREIGILKAIGWDTGDILQLRCLEGFAISALALLGGFFLSYLHVFYFGAALLDPIIRGWSVLFPALKPLPAVDLTAVARIFFLVAVPYIAATVIPSWKAARSDPDEVIRS